MTYQGVLEVVRAGHGRAWALEVLADPSTLSAVHHPLGFVCLPLERDGAEGVCLHLWSDRLGQAESTTSQIHCHSWDLLSHVLYGRVRNVHANVAEAGSGATHRVFEIISGAAGDRIEPTPRTVRQRAGVVEEFGPGQTYTLKAGRFHSTAVPSGTVAVTIALGRGTPGAHDLSLGPLTTPAHHVARHRLDPWQLSQAAKLIVEHLI